jgi:hypothetical protein
MKEEIILVIEDTQKSMDYLKYQTEFEILMNHGAVNVRDFNDRVSDAIVFGKRYKVTIEEVSDN